LSRLAVMLVLAAALAVGTASGARRAAADTTAPSVYTDASGDSASAPDITKVTLTPGAATVAVDIAYAGGFADDAALGFGIDSDRSPQTGQSGLDYLILMTKNGYIFGKWDGTGFNAFTHQPTNASLSDTDAVLTLTLADIGGVSTFDFVTISLRGNDTDGLPENGLATYPVVVPPPTVKAVILPGQIFQARAGKTLRIPRLQVQLSDATIAPVTSQTCTLAWKGKRLPALAGGCAWLIPKKAKGGRLTLKVTYVYGGASRAVSWPVVAR
jgi:hypothetical protein